MRQRLAPEIDACALLDLAYEYAWAADTLVMAKCIETPQVTMIIHAPTNFLYFHTVELCCKAVIKAKSEPLFVSHNLQELYQQAFDLGLRVAEGKTMNEAGACISGLASQNERNAFRYFDGRDGNSLDAAKVQQFVRRLVDATDLFVAKYAPARTIKPRRLRFVLPFQVAPWTSAPVVPEALPEIPHVSPLQPRRRQPT